MKTIKCLIALLVLLILFAAANLFRTRVYNLHMAAAGLRRQDVGTLDVKYSIFEPKVKPLMRFHYQRTSQACRLDIAYDLAHTKGAADADHYSYDREKDETRSLSLYSGRVHGDIHRGKYGRMFSGEAFETGQLPVGGDGCVLADAITKYGESLGQEAVDGHDCLKIKLNMPEEKEHTTVWLDPEIGYCPRKYLVTTPVKHLIVMNKEFRDYHEVSSGIWFPKEMHLSWPYSSDDGTVETRTYKVASIKYSEGTTVPKADLLVTFPHGLNVRVNDRDKVRF